MSITMQYDIVEIAKLYADLASAKAEVATLQERLAYARRQIVNIQYAASGEAPPTMETTP